MNKEEIFNEISSCFKMSVDMNGMKKLEEYITNLQQQNQKYKEVIDKANKLLKEKVKVIPFDENGEGGGLELTDYDIQDLLDILKEVSE